MQNDYRAINISLKIKFGLQHSDKLYINLSCDISCSILERMPPITDLSKVNNCLTKRTKKVFLKGTYWCHHHCHHHCRRHHPLPPLDGSWLPCRPSCHGQLPVSPTTQLPGQGGHSGNHPQWLPLFHLGKISKIKSQLYQSYHLRSDEQKILKILKVIIEVTCLNRRLLQLWRCRLWWPLSRLRL